MRFMDLISLPLSALWQQKMRTLLTTLGVVFGSFVLAASLSIGQGVQDIIEHISRRNDVLRKIQVGIRYRPKVPDPAHHKVEVKGVFEEGRKQRLQRSIVGDDQASSTVDVIIDRQTLQKLAAIPHVEQVVPTVFARGFAVLNDWSQYATIGSSPAENPECQTRIVAGRFFQSSHEKSLVLHEYLLYQLGLTTDADMEAAVGRQIRLEFRRMHGQTKFELYLHKSDNTHSTREELAVVDKITNQLPAIVPQLGLTAADLLVLKNTFQSGPPPATQTFQHTFTIVGILRSRTPEEDRMHWDPLRTHTEIVLPSQMAVDLIEDVLPKGSEVADRAVVMIDRAEHARSVVDQINEVGLQAWAPLEHIERERLMYLLIFGGMTCVAAVALLVAALGIANTMLMSVLERTREIGIMKAVGAGNGTLQFIFLLEGALIGLLGGSCGLLACWGASFPGDVYIRNLVSRDMKFDIEGSLFVFPPWLMVVVMTFAVLVTTLAAVCPALRAARIDPVTALRHE